MKYGDVVRGLEFKAAGNAPTLAAKLEAEARAKRIAALRVEKLQLDAVLRNIYAVGRRVGFLNGKPSTSKTHAKLRSIKAELRKLGAL